MGSTSPAANSKPHKRGRLPQALKDNALSTLGMEDIDFVNVRQIRKYTTQMPIEAKRINQLTLGSAWGIWKLHSPSTYMLWGAPFLFKDL